MDHDDDLAPSERKALEALPRERAPNPMLEERVVQALRDRGVLVPRRRRALYVSLRKVSSAGEERGGLAWRRTRKT